MWQMILKSRAAVGRGVLIVLLSTIFCMVGGWVATRFEKPIYQGSVLMAMYSLPHGAVPVNGLDQTASLDASYTTAVLDNPRVMADVRQLYPQLTPAQVRSMVTVTAVDFSSLAWVRATASAPGMADGLANAVAQSFVEDGDVTRSHIYNAALQPIQAHIAADDAKIQAIVTAPNQPAPGTPAANAQLAQLTALENDRANWSKEAEDLQIAEANALGAIRVIHPALPPVPLIHPDTRKIMEYSAFLGLVIGIVLVLLAYRRNVPGWLRALFFDQYPDDSGDQPPPAPAKRNGAVSHPGREGGSSFRPVLPFLNFVAAPWPFRTGMQPSAASLPLDGTTALAPSLPFTTEVVLRIRRALPFLCLALGSALFGVGVSINPFVASLVFGCMLAVYALIWPPVPGSRIITIGCLFAFLIPWGFSITTYGFSIPEMLAYGLCVLWLFARPGVTWRTSVRQVLLAIGGFLGIALLLFAVAVLQSDLHPVVRDPMYLFQHTRLDLVYPIVVLIVGIFAARGRQARYFFGAFVLGAVVLAGYAFMLPWWGEPVLNEAVAGRLGAQAAPIGNFHPNSLSTYFAMAMALAAALAVTERGVARWAFVGAFVFLGIGVWFTYSRAALLALIMAIVVVAILLVVARPQLRRPVLIGFATVVVLAALVLVLDPHVAGRYLTLLHPTHLLDSPDVTIRTGIDGQVIHQVIFRHPLLGVGLDQGETATGTPLSAHNTYIDLWAGTGILGLVGFAGVIVALAFYAIRAMFRGLSGYEMALLLGCLGAVVVFAVAAAFETLDGEWRDTPGYWMVVGMMLGILSTAMAARATPKSGLTAQPSVVEIS